MSVVTKIAIQLNCKMGGEVWGVEIPVSILYIFKTCNVMCGNLVIKSFENFHRKNTRLRSGMIFIHVKNRIK